MGGVLGAGFWKNHSVARSRVAARVVDLAAEPARPIQATTDNLSITKKVLIPVDGTASALQAVHHVINQFLIDPKTEVHLLHVRAPFSQHISLFVGMRNRQSYHREMAEKTLQSAHDLLDQHGVPHASHIELGDTVAVIDRVAQHLCVDRIVMGTARKNTLTRLMEDSVTSKVLETARVPVEVIAGAAAPRWERIGIPVGVSAALAVLFMAAADW
ncbi:MAG TPA: universal stress protein [Burkholderiales bacterium]|nr:universal stress protein [Burkholderiales bacterium]